MPGTLLVTIDTEEEFEWHAPVSPQNRSVRHAAHLPRLQELFESVGVRPTYVVDHPIAATDESVEVLSEFLARDACEIGAHIHPWVNPPYEETIEPRHSYLCNLPLPLQQDKVARLTEAIESSFGQRPTTFKAGRYGLDMALTPFLAKLGYTVDTSVIAYMDFSADEGPDFSRFGNAPFRLAPPLTPPLGDAEPLWEIPCTVGFTRRPFDSWARLHQELSRDRWRIMRPIGLLWHSRIVRKVVLSPEGFETSDLLALLRVLAREPDPVLNVTLHSPSIQPGNTPYVKTERELVEFLARLRAVLELAVGLLGARCMTLREYAASMKETAVV